MHVRNNSLLTKLEPTYMNSVEVMNIDMNKYPVQTSKNFLACTVKSFWERRTLNNRILTL